MRIDVSQAARRLAAHNNILILAHAHPDGDTLGSAFALCRMLRALGKKANAACGDTIPPAYNFMLQGLEEEHFEAEYVVAVDTADIKLLGHDMRETYAGKVDLCIDHHGSNTLFAAETLLMEKSASTAEIIALLFVETGVAIDSAAADCLYTGLST
ncbi:MAG TPA: DHH family phosphoesterase, partial [Clostridiales bacterium]|nr:DHH family phosphoesterase [Clostridiales bacterium]